jgi:hypothetical protein
MSECNNRVRADARHDRDDVLGSEKGGFVAANWTQLVTLTVQSSFNLGLLYTRMNDNALSQETQTGLRSKPRSADLPDTRYCSRFSVSAFVVCMSASQPTLNTPVIAPQSK